MRVKNILSFIVGACLVVGIAFAEEKGIFRPNTEPEAFRDMKWGTDMATLSGFELVEEHGAGMKKYVKADDSYAWKGTELKNIEYLFWRDKFYQVNLYPQDSENWAKAKEYVSSTYGGGLPSQGCLYWLGPIARVGYCEPTGETSFLWITSNRIDRNWFR